MSNHQNKKIKAIDEVCQSLFENCLLPYQVKLIQDRSKLRIVEKSRRVGITWALALEAVLKRCVGSRELDLNVSSADYKMGLEFIKYCRDFSEAINQACGYEAIPVSEWTLDTARFKNGSRIFAISSDPKSFRGRRHEVLLDEIAFSDDPDELIKAAQPLIIRDPDTQMTLVSSHNGMETTFYRLCRGAEAKENEYSHHRITIEDACRDGFALTIEGKHKELLDGTEAGLEACNRAFIDFVRNSCLSEADFLQEYMCVPASSASVVYPDLYDQLILKYEGRPLEIPNVMPPDDTRLGELFVGIDCGRVKDYTVVWVIERGYDPTAIHSESRVYRTVCVDWMTNMSIPDQFDRIRRNLTHPMITKVVIDMGSIGRGLSDALQDELGDIVEPLAFSSTNKQHIAELVKLFTHQKRVSLHPDQFVKADVTCVKRSVNPKSQRVTYDGRTKDSHGDFFWALGLSLYAAESEFEDYYAGSVEVDGVAIVRD
ncbi:MAG: hypothetical protein KatS3mg104_3060 [Phycisphaerae bacterium]|nr:MAG: hypothetical protein KatS3mg104_3060 [Phycisphaerae bacterium]